MVILRSRLLPALHYLLPQAPPQGNDLLDTYPYLDPRGGVGGNPEGLLGFQQMAGTHSAQNHRPITALQDAGASRLGPQRPLSCETVQSTALCFRSAMS